MPFLVLALVGLTLSVVVHGAALLGFSALLGKAVWGLHVGIFVVWIPTMFVANRLAADFKRKDLWKAVLRGCPRWMRWLVHGLFAYAILNFVIFVANVPAKVPGSSANESPLVLRGFSGHWMLFYAVAAGTLHSAITVARADPARRCGKGHPVSPSSKFCEVCGEGLSQAGSAPT